MTTAQMASSTPTTKNLDAVKLMIVTATVSR